MANTSERQVVKVTALNGDVVDYSRLLADDRDATTEKMGQLRDVIVDLVSANDGILVDFAGDNFMAVFPNVIAGMRVAIAATADVESVNAGAPSQTRVRFRMGLDNGEAVIDGQGQYFGEALNVAARIQAIAIAGGISVSGRVYSALDEPELRFRPRGTQVLKNIPGGVEVYDFADFPSDGSRTPEGLGLEAPSLALLPTHSEDEDEMGATVRGDLIHRLAAIPQLSLIDLRPDAEGEVDAGHARYMLESGVRRSGDKVRLHATLYDVSLSTVVKSHKVTGAADQIFELSEDLAEQVGSHVEIDLVVGAPGAIYADLADPVAIGHVYQGWYHLTAGTPEHWGMAVEYFQKVADSHPDQPSGAVLLSFAHWMGALYQWTDDIEGSMTQAREMALVAREADPTGMAEMVLAAVHLSDGDTEAAERAVETAQITRPTCDTTFGLAGSVRRYMGEWDKAIDLEDRAMRLTGVNKPWYPTVKACSMFMSGRHEQAASVAEMVIANQPNNLEALLVLAGAQVELGLDRRARATGEQIREFFPGIDVEEWIDRNPYQDRDAVRRWKDDLRSAAII